MYLDILTLLQIRTGFGALAGLLFGKHLGLGFRRWVSSAPFQAHPAASWGDLSSGLLTLSHSKDWTPEGNSQKYGF